MTSLSLCFQRPPPGTAFPSSTSNTRKVNYKVAQVSSSSDNNGTTMTMTLSLPEGLKPELMPRHIAVTGDGNRRWAEENGLPPCEGHRAGGKALVNFVRHCCAWGLEALTIFICSPENLGGRPEDQVDGILSLLKEMLENDAAQFTRAGVNMRFIGDKTGLPNSILDLMNSLEEASKHNSGLRCLVAFNYGGRHDILQASKSIAEKVKDGVIQLEDIDEGTFAQELYTKSMDYPDLLIRAGGEYRISNFLLWQIAFTELYFCDKLFPDFGEEDLLEAIKTFQRRKRRYGK